LPTSSPTVVLAKACLIVFLLFSVDRWLRDHNAKCPLCKKDIREDWEDEDEEVWDPIAGQWVREAIETGSEYSGSEDDDDDDGGGGGDGDGKVAN